MSTFFVRHPRLSALIYVGAVVVCCLATALAIGDLIDRYHARDTSLHMLSRLKGHSRGNARDILPPGSPFLEGQTVTVAGATLLQRITSSITNAGGTIISSEMVQQGARSKNGYVTAIADCEIAQEALQRVLYDIEAGLPLLFIDQLLVQTSSTPQEGGRLRVQIGVAGLWSRG